MLMLMMVLVVRVDANDGATLASFTADIDFDVSDTVAAISSVLTTTSLQTTIPAPINQGLAWCDWTCRIHKYKWVHP